MATRAQRRMINNYINNKVGIRTFGTSVPSSMFSKVDGALSRNNYVAGAKNKRAAMRQVGMNNNPMLRGKTPSNVGAGGNAKSGKSGKS